MLLQTRSVFFPIPVFSLSAFRLVLHIFFFNRHDLVLQLLNILCSFFFAPSKFSFEFLEAAFMLLRNRRQDALTSSRRFNIVCPRFSPRVFQDALTSSFQDYRQESFKTDSVGSKGVLSRLPVRIISVTLAKSLIRRLNNVS